MVLRGMLKRVQDLESVENASLSAFVVIRRMNGQVIRLLWSEAIVEALDGNIEAVLDGEMGELVKALM